LIEFPAIREYQMNIINPLYINLNMKRIELNKRRNKRRGKKEKKNLEMCDID